MLGGLGIFFADLAGCSGMFMDVGGFAVNFGRFSLILVFVRWILVDFSVSGYVCGVPGCPAAFVGVPTRISVYVSVPGNMFGLTNCISICILVGPAIYSVPSHIPGFKSN